MWLGTAIRKATVIPFLIQNHRPFVAGVLGALLLAHFGVYPGWTELAIFAVMHVMAMVGIEAGLHRYASHRAFDCRRWFHWTLLLMGSMCGVGSPIWWATLHRKHHKYSDEPSDPHSPIDPYTGKFSYKRAFKIHLFSQFAYNQREDRETLLTDLKDDPAMRFCEDTAALWRIVPVIVPGIIGWAVHRSLNGFLLGAIYAGFLREWFSIQCLVLINTITHGPGLHPFATGDHSSNQPLMLPLVLGGHLHNSHHAFPFAASNQLRWWDFDPIGWGLYGLKAIGVVTKMRKPTREGIESKLRTRNAQVQAHRG